MSSESKTSSNRGLGIAIELLTSLLGVYAIMTDKVEGLESYSPFQKIGLCIALVVIVFCIDLVLRRGRIFLELIGYAVLLFLILFFISELFNISIVENKSGVKWQKGNMTMAIGNAPLYVRADSINYGRYYTFEQAKKVCDDLRPGKWRLPSMNEFKQLVANCGGEVLAFQKLTDGGCEIQLPLAGYCKDTTGEITIEDFERVTEVGYYWTRDYSQKQSNEVMTFVLNLRTQKAEYYHDYDPKNPTHNFSCRCVKVND